MEIATRFLPHWLTILLRKIKYFGRERHCLLCGGNVRFFRSFGVVPRSNVYCPVCRSLDRHRLLWKFFQKHTNLLDQTFKSMLHVAPEPEIDRKLIKVPSIQYVTADLYKTDVMEKMDITDIHYADNSFDVICCCHVLEHVSDDRKAVNEFYRVLKPNGWAVLMVPIIRETTFEDPSVTDPLERRKVFGDKNHCRAYGKDFDHRVGESGFAVQAISASEIIDPKEFERLGITVGEEIFLCRKM